jgi:hypothetical protein
MSNVSLHICILLILLLIYTHNQQISATSIYREKAYEPESLLYDDDQSRMSFQRENLLYEPNDDEIPSSKPWPGIIHSNYIQPVPNIRLRSGIVRVIPYKKRTIPLTLQKALYAHGIIGRRR